MFTTEQRVFQLMIILAVAIALQKQTAYKGFDNRLGTSGRTGSASIECGHITLGTDRV